MFPNIHIGGGDGNFQGDLVNYMYAYAPALSIARSSTTMILKIWLYYPYCNFRGHSVTFALLMSRNNNKVRSQIILFVWENVKKKRKNINMYITVVLDSFGFAATIKKCNLIMIFAKIFSGWSPRKLVPFPKWCIVHHTTCWRNLRQYIKTRSCTYVGQ